MASPTITEITQAIDDTLSAAGVTTQSLTSLTEAIQDPPLVQIYYSAEDADTGGTSRMTLAGANAQSHMTFVIDAYARQRAHIGEDLAAVATLAQAIRVVLKAQARPFFGLEGIGSFHWSASYAPFEYGGVAYAGIRFEVELWVQ